MTDASTHDEASYIYYASLSATQSHNFIHLWNWFFIFALRKCIKISLYKMIIFFIIPVIVLLRYLVLIGPHWPRAVVPGRFPSMS